MILVATLKDNSISEKLLKNVAKMLESGWYIKAEDEVFKFAGVIPYEKEYRNHIDWLYLSLWIATIWYQFSLLLCFFLYPSHWFSDLLGLLYDTYFIAVAGYGIFNIVHRYYPNDRRKINIGIDTEKRKRRNGHRFIGYWWLNFLTMLSASIFFGYPNDLSGPLGISLKTAVACSAIGFGYKLAKKKMTSSCATTE